MIRTIRTGAIRVASELSTMAAKAPTQAFFSVANNGTSFLPDSQNERFCPMRFCVSSLYFIVARASLGIEELDIFGRCLHQLLVCADGEHLAFHQQDNLIVVGHRCNLLRD